MLRCRHLDPIFGIQVEYEDCVAAIHANYAAVDDEKLQVGMQDSLVVRDLFWSISSRLNRLPVGVFNLGEIAELLEEFLTVAKEFEVCFPEVCKVPILQVLPTVNVKASLINQKSYWSLWKKL